MADTSKDGLLLAEEYTTSQLVNYIGIHARKLTAVDAIF